MKSRSITIVSIFLLCFFSCKKAEKLNSKDKDEYQFVINSKRILNNENLLKLISKLESTELQTENETKKIDGVIFDFLQAYDPSFSIANPNEKWNATDVIADKTLPRRKLLYFGNGKNIAILNYNLGGTGMSTKILIFEFDSEKVTDFWCGSVLVDLKTKEQTIEYLKENIDRKWGLNTNILAF